MHTVITGRNRNTLSHESVSVEEIAGMKRIRTRLELVVEGVDAGGGKDGWSPAFRLPPLREVLRVVGDIE